MNPQDQDQNPASAPPQAPESPESDPTTSSAEQTPTFEHIDDLPESETGSSAPAKVVVEPYSDEEIVNGVAVAVMLGMVQQGQIRNAREETVFTNSFTRFTPVALKSLKIGEALATYGIGKNTGVGGFERLPPMMRLALGVVGIGVGVGMGLQAVARERSSGIEADREAA